MTAWLVMVIGLPVTLEMKGVSTVKLYWTLT